MKRILLTCFIFIGFLLAGCSNDETTVQIIRTPSLTCNVNGIPWKADTYSFSAVSKVVVYPADPNQSGQFFNRFTLQSSGRDSVGNTYQLIIMFDVLDMTQLAGAYTPVYTAQRGLAQAQLFDLTNSNDLSAFNLCGNNTNNASFQIQKQGVNEKLISGDFQMTLCNSRDTTQKLNITNGIFKDIKY